MKTISECLNLIDNVLCAKVNEFRALEDLELVREFVIQTDMSKSLNKDGQINNPTLDVLEKINYIIEKAYEKNMSGMSLGYVKLRKLMFIWLDAVYCNIE